LLGITDPKLDVIKSKVFNGWLVGKKRSEKLRSTRVGKKGKMYFIMRDVRCEVFEKAKAHAMAEIPRRQFLGHLKRYFSKAHDVNNNVVWNILTWFLKVYLLAFVSV